ncbi:transcriptional activator of the psp operon with PspB, phage shock protein [Catenovulum agarivorans DS-2]|uniref:Transcriptional activator of the psp operon with PspB, phage shock protein n=1 Tax=Catenovulum agarivorans DS-2 TaxID=1328313 RepID=W7QS63_9ALTE|nr:envelope stress response membrane protein PspC [Catenovulum agarivorans]EWH11857.1 transcriptional activator of the psp operon with PspB, phage shock protein [Catenovulum agarivorans DS-2]
MTATNKKLTRDVHNGRIAGVCAGIANYFSLETWVVRLVTVGALIFSFSFILFVYIAAWLILERNDKVKPARVYETNTRDNYHFDIKQNVWQAGSPPKVVLSDLAEVFERLELRVRNLEVYATSERYRVEKEINKL